MMMTPIYFDNAATSWPKPPSVRVALDRWFDEAGGNPGRSGHRMSIAAAQIVEDAREAVAELFNIPDPARLVFTKNATEALNLAILGLVRPGGHVVTTSIEHNSVMRPLRHLESLGVELTVVDCARDGTIEAERVARAIRPDTSLLVTIHGSNVTGTLLPVGRLAAICRERGVPYLVDAAQTAGSVPIDVQALGLGLMAFPGHKGLLGPTGTGVLYIGDDLPISPIMRGGTGSRSDLEIQPDFMPDMYESGTLNVAGLAGLGASVRHLLHIGVATVEAHERALVARFLEGAKHIPQLVIHGPDELALRCGVLSFNLEGMPPSDVGLILDRDYSILSRVGLHCAPGAHRTIGTLPMGSVRFGFGPSNTELEVDTALGALEDLDAWIAINALGERAGHA
jgi:cysteine desulfurase family protein